MSSNDLGYEHAADAPSHRAFKATIYRLVVFFIGSALAIGILVPYNDPGLLGAIAADAAGGGKSPYVISMQRLAIPVLPAIVNALILTSVFSAGNAFRESALSSPSRSR